MATHDDDPSNPDAPKFRPQAVLDPSGRLEETGAARGPRSPPLQPLHEAPPLELEERAPRPEGHFELDKRYRDDVPPKRRVPVWAMLVALVVVTAGAALLVDPDLSRSVKRALPSAPPPFLYVHSEPSGATITVGDTVLGETPYVGENAYTGEVPIRLTLKGYKPWRGTFEGGAEARISATLKR